MIEIVKNKNKNKIIKILVTGGAGYIGSVTVKKLLDSGYKVTVIDNLKKGMKRLVDKRATFHKIDITNFLALEKKLNGKYFDVVIHFAALKDAGESMVCPDLYHNNIVGTMNLIKIAPKLKVKKIIFSSSAAVYGEPKLDFIDENHTCNPASFYGYTKLVGEQLLEWTRKLNNIDYISLRYFNVAGDGGLNYVNSNVKNVFNVIGEVVCGRKKHLEIYGNDYNTRDGYGIRDYIHVSDLADAHIKALKVEGSHIINLGSEKGYSVLEIVKEFEKVLNKKVPFKVIGRRAGDVARLIATSKKAKKILNWTPKLGLNDMVESTLIAYSKN